MTVQTLEEELLRHQPASLLRIPLQEGLDRWNIRSLRSTSGQNKNHRVENPGGFRTF